MKHTFKNIIVSLIVIVSGIVFFPRSAYPRDNPFDFITDPFSAASSDDAFASIRNPAFSGIPGESSFGYRYFSFFDRKNADHFAYMNAFGFSFFYGWLDHVYSPDSREIAHSGTNFFSIQKGFDFNVFVLGAGYSFTSGGVSPYDKYGSWTVGFLLRPVRFVSFGYSLCNIGSELGGEKIRRKDIYSLSVRPFGERLTLSVDAERESARAMDFLFAADFRFRNDISLFVKTGTDLNTRFGLTLPFLFLGEVPRTVLLNSGGSMNRRSQNSYFFGFALSKEKYKNAPVATQRAMLLIEIDGTIQENAEQKMFKEKDIIHFSLVQAIKTAREDSSIAGIILKIGEAGLGFAQIQEIRSELTEFRKAGKKAYAVMAAPGNRQYYLASACDKIYFTPNSLFYISGLSAEVYFFKGLLDRAGVKVESISKGKYKSFNEAYTREHLSDEFRENLTSLLRDLNDQFVGDIASGRGIARQKIEELFAKGFMGAKDAVAEKFIDEIKYYDDALMDLTRDKTTISLRSYINDTEKKFRWGAIPAVAVVYINGSIISGKTRDSDVFDTMGDETYARLLGEAFDESRAVVIRINSGGGSAAASDYMLNSLIRIKKRYNIPVVLSFGSMAASGGYYVACSGDRILASRGTLTGSIGVVTGKISAKVLYEKLGINKDVIKMSEFADIFSESKDLSEKERDLIQRGVDYVYDRFTEKVVAARRIDKSKIPDIAEGRVFTGAQAREKNMVDEFGGLLAAIEYAKVKAGIEGECEIRQYPEKVSFLPEMLSK